MILISTPISGEGQHGVDAIALTVAGSSGEYGGVL
jgi:hypothetical protein